MKKPLFPAGEKGRFFLINAFFLPIFENATVLSGIGTGFRPEGRNWLPRLHRAESLHLSGWENRNIAKTELTTQISKLSAFVVMILRFASIVNRFSKIFF
jgi:hypothetical protein